MPEQRNKPSEKPGDYEDKRLYGPVATVFSSTNTGSWRILRPVVDYSRCSKCGTCRKYCPTDVIEIKVDDAQCIEINWNYCKGCGVCANVCVKKCIAMEDEENAKQEIESEK